MIPSNFKSYLIFYLLLQLTLITSTQAQVERLAAPKDIELAGAIRKEHIVTSLGNVELRWPRKAESLFGRSPQRAVADAMLTASRALRQAGFNTELRSFKNNWQIVFMDEEVPETQVPQYLVDNCHPAWMTPPGNIYVVAQRVVAGCGGGSKISTQVADAKLVQILLHEIGHALEMHLIGNMPRDLMLVEGFASWFEQYASNYSAFIKSGVLKEEYKQLAKISYRQSPKQFVFSSSQIDYARASQYFWQIVDVKGVAALMQVYDEMRKSRRDFFEVVEKRLYWKRNKIEQDIANRLG